MICGAWFQKPCVRAQLAANKKGCASLLAKLSLPIFFEDLPTSAFIRICRALMNRSSATCPDVSRRLPTIETLLLTAR
jgi:hypothetical protein